MLCILIHTNLKNVITPDKNCILLYGEICTFGGTVYIDDPADVLFHLLEELLLQASIWVFMVMTEPLASFEVSMAVKIQVEVILP
jgi:hypothetical protein